MQANFAEFPGFSRKFRLKRNFRELSRGLLFQCARNFEGKFAVTLMSREISSEISLFSKVRCAISTKFRSGYTVSVLIQLRAKYVVCFCVLWFCVLFLWFVFSAAQKISEISFINSIDFSILLTLSLK